MHFQVASSYERHKHLTSWKTTEINIFNYVASHCLLKVKKNLIQIYTNYCLYMYCGSISMSWMWIYLHVINGLEEGKVFWKLKLPFFICLATVHASHSDDSILSSLLCKPVRCNVLSSVFEMKLFEFMDINLFPLYFQFWILSLKMIPPL